MGTLRAKVEFVLKYKPWYSVEYLCKQVKLKESTYCYNLKHDTSPKYDENLLNKIEILHRVYDELGYRSITNQLWEYFGIKVNENTVLRYMRKLGIQAVYYYKAKAPYPKHNPKFECPNLITNTKPTKPNQIWNIDISYFKLLDKSNAFLFLIKDAFDGRVVNMNFSKIFNTLLVLDTLEDAINLNDISELTIHSDHGSQFISKDVVKLLKVYGVQQSMSDLGSPGQNQMVESIFGWIKNTLKPRNLHLTFEETKLKLEWWIFRYNYIDIFKGKTRSVWGTDALSLTY